MLVIAFILVSFTPFDTFTCLSEYICTLNKFDKNCIKLAQFHESLKALDMFGNHLNDILALSFAW